MNISNFKVVLLALVSLSLTRCDNYLPLQMSEISFNNKPVAHQIGVDQTIWDGTTEASTKALKKGLAVFTSGRVEFNREVNSSDTHIDLGKIIQKDGRFYQHIELPAYTRGGIIDYSAPSESDKLATLVVQFGKLKYDGSSSSPIHFTGGFKNDKLNKYDLSPIGVKDFSSALFYFIPDVLSPNLQAKILSAEADKDLLFDVTLPDGPVILLRQADAFNSTDRKDDLIQSI